MAEEAHHTASIGSWASRGFRIGSQIMIVSAKSPQLPLPSQRTLYADYARVLPISNLEPVFNEISKGKKRQKYNVTKKARLKIGYFSSTIFGSSVRVDGKNNRHE